VRLPAFVVMDALAALLIGKGQQTPPLL